jgi:predicted nucleic acid-binding protein
MPSWKRLRLSHRLPTNLRDSTSSSQGVAAATRLIGDARPSMATPEAADTVFVDTSVLLAATDPQRSSHSRALAVFEVWPADHTLVMSGQILREYLVVATRPVSSNGLDLGIADALKNAEALSRRAALLDEDESVRLRLRQLVSRYDIRGARLHDANILATMLARGVRQILTENAQDFEFCSEVEVLAL